LVKDQAAHESSKITFRPISLIAEIGNNQLCRISNRLKSLLFST